MKISRSQLVLITTFFLASASFANEDVTGTETTDNNVVSEYEMPSRKSRQVLDEADTNNDGKLSRAEVRDARRRHLAHPGERQAEISDQIHERRDDRDYRSEQREDRYQERDDDVEIKNEEQREERYDDLQKRRGW